MVLSFFDWFAVGTILESIKFDDYARDNWVFRLHYKATAVLLTACSFVLTLTMYFGEPISCGKRGSDDIYCWLMGIFSNADTLTGRKKGDYGYYPGVDLTRPDTERIYHTYYKWVVLVLLGQAGSFYLPRYIWRRCDNNRLHELIVGMDKTDVHEDSQKQIVSLLITYFKVTLGHHNLYFSYYLFCEVLNFVNVLLQFYLTNLFLGRDLFNTYGLDVVRFYNGMIDTATNPGKVSPMVAAFPFLAKCEFYETTEANTIVKDGAICQLPLNPIHQKLYLVLWFWYVFLALLTGLALLYRLLVLLTPPLRRLLIRICCWTELDVQHLDVVLQAGKVGDWFILYLLAKNTYSENYAKFIKDFSEAIIRRRQKHEEKAKQQRGPSTSKQQAKPSRLTIKGVKKRLTKVMETTF